MIKTKSNFIKLSAYIFLFNFGLQELIGMESPNKVQVKILIPSSKINLEEAVINNDIEWVKINIQNEKHTMLIPNSEGYTPIDLAVCNNRIEIVELLVQNNLEAVLKKSPCGYTPLEIAKYYKHEYLVSYLTQIKDMREKTRDKQARILLYGNYHPNPYKTNN